MLIIYQYFSLLIFKSHDSHPNLVSRPLRNSLSFRPVPQILILYLDLESATVASKLTHTARTR